MSDRTLSINTPRVVHETIDGEVIVIDLATGTYFSLQGGAADIWVLIGTGHSLDQMIPALAASYGESHESIRATLEPFITELESEALVVAGAGTTTPTGPPEIGANGAFAPRLEKHTDMTELILLDPVHEVDSLGWPHRPAGDAQGTG